MNYKTKDKNQWTQEDTRAAIEDGYYLDAPQRKTRRVTAVRTTHTLASGRRIVLPAGLPVTVQTYSQSQPDGDWPRYKIAALPKYMHEDCQIESHWLLRGFNVSPIDVATETEATEDFNEKLKQHRRRLIEIM